MKRAVVCVTVALLFNALVSTAFAGGNANFVLGGRSLDDEQAWAPFESQHVLGVTVDFSLQGSPVQFEAGMQRSRKTESRFGPHFTGGIDEISFGVNKTWDLRGRRMHPFAGGGAEELRVVVHGAGNTTADTSPGLYAHGGIFWRIGRRFNIGFDGRTVAWTKVHFGGFSFNANYHQLDLLLGWGWHSGR